MHIFSTPRFPVSKCTRTRPLLCLAASLLLLCAHHAQAQDWDKDFKAFPKTIKPSNDKVTLDPANPTTQDGLTILATPESGGYPGVSITPPKGEPWDFSNYTGMDLIAENLGENRVYLTIRVDNEGHWQTKPWNTAAALVQPGQRKRITLYFGYSGKKPKPLDSSKIKGIQIFTQKAKEAQQVKIESLKLIKSPVPYLPNQKPIDGYLVGAAGNAIEKKYQAKGGATVSGGNGDEPLAISFSGPEQSVSIAPKSDSKWDLRQGYQLKVKVSNTGSTSANPTALASSGKNVTDTATLPKPIAPGEQGELTITFIANKATDVTLGKREPFFESNKANAVVISSGNEAGAQSFTVDSVRLVAPPLQLPDWVGKRPPVEGDWEMTFNEEFNADNLDRSKWRIHAPNYWDKRSVFSENNVKIQDGNAVLIYEHEFNHHNDDPNHERTGEYTTGHLDTYGRWVQRYGYFETRLKLPKAPGLWPAFWLMPDRGVEAGEQWRRQHTLHGGGMEFDILEFLSGWGPYRFTTAFHWDGYGAEHKAIGAGVYSGHDEDGYVTSGLLWLPGLAVIYANGKEVTRWESDRISDVESCIIFTHVGGGWDNEPIDNAQLPDNTYIDYVRVWQRADLASAVDGYQADSTLAQSDGE